MTSRCRICLDTSGSLFKLCNCTDVYVHLECASQWYKYRIHGNMTGLAHEEHWTMYWYSLCEICNTIINPKVTKYSLSRLKYPKINSIYDSYLFKDYK